MDSLKKISLKEFQKIPGIGPSIANDLWNLGFKHIADLKGANPEKLYADLCKLQGCKVDRCMLYVFRCAVYFASHTTHQPDLLQWWNWKDSEKY